MFKNLALSLAVLSITPVVVLAQSSTSRQECEPLGRITASTDSRVAPGTLICNGEHLQPSVSGKVSVFCYWSGRILKLVGSTKQLDNCRPSSAVFVPCSPLSRYCRRSRGPEEAGNSPTLITPYGNTLLSSRPAFSWSPVAGATRYILQVRSAAEGWQTEVEGTSVSYPAGKPALAAGSVYQIEVLAYAGDTVLGTSNKKINILPLETAQELSTLVKQIRSLNLPEDEKAFLDLNAAYSARGLVDEAIRLLKARIEVGSRNPGVYRALGDRFLTAGLHNKAKSQYEVAKNLAQASANVVELNKARTGLRLVALLRQESVPARP